jgi:hypothetical protein
MHYTLALPRGQYQADLLGAFLPTSNQLIAPHVATTISNHFADNLSENGSYLGLPLVLLLVGSAILCRRSKVVIVACLAALSAYVLSLGSPLLVENRFISWFHLPGALLQHLPLLEGAAMARFAVFVVLFAALVLGLAIERLRTWPGWSDHRIGPIAAIGTGIVVLLPLLPNLPYGAAVADTPSFFTSSAVDSVPANSVAVVYPPTAAQTTHPNPDSTLWQASADMRFQMPGAYALVPGVGGRARWGTPTLTTRTLVAIESGAKVRQTAALRAALRAQWRSWNVQTFIMGPGKKESTARRFVTWVIGRAPEYQEGVYVWYRLGQPGAS